MAKRFYSKLMMPALILLGFLKTPDTTAVTVLEEDESGYVVRAKGETVPTDAETGYAKGCKFVKTDGVAGTTEYTNEGDESSCDFNALIATAGDITAVVAGTGLTGGATSGSATVALAAGYTPTHRVVAAGVFTTAGGDASETISGLTGITAADIAIVTVKTAGATPRSIVAAAAGTASIAVTMSGDPSTDHVLAYQVLRAVS